MVILFAAPPAQFTAVYHMVQGERTRVQILAIWCREGETRLRKHIMLVQFLYYTDHCLTVGESIVVTYFVSEC